MSFSAYAARNLKTVDPTNCPGLRQLSIDVTEVSSLDVSKNPALEILNISETYIKEIDLSNNPKLTQFYATRGSSKYDGYLLENIDLTHNPELFYLYLGYNALTELDLSKNTKLFDLSVNNNRLGGLDLTNNTNLYNVDIRNNYMGFATLPNDPGTWNVFFYQQKAYPVERSYKVGTEIDFTSSMMREGTETLATLYHVNEDDFSMPIPADPSTYKFENGRLTLLEAFTDSVFVTFDNSLYSLYPISTSNFMVKTESDFGKPAEMVNFMPGVSTGQPVTFTVGVAGASTTSPKTFYVDFGNDQLQEFTATGSGIADGCVVSGAYQGAYVRVYMPENNDMTALSIENQTLYGITLEAASMLRELTLAGTGLYDIDLARLRCLKSLYLTGNNFYNFSLEGKNYYFVKNVLDNLVIPANNISNLTTEGFEAIKHIDASNNNLEEFQFGSAKQAQTINVSNNRLTEADLSSCAELLSIDLTGNNISTLTLPEESLLEELKIGDNNMTLENLPDPSLFASYSYAPQARVNIPVKGPGADLASQNRIIDGQATVYNWMKADGTLLTEGVDYAITDGKTRFLKDDLGYVYCAMTHPAFPEFSIEGGTALLSTNIEVAAMPTNVIASFTTPVGGETASVSLASTAPNTSIFIDWKGDGIELLSYDLNTSYTLFDATTYPGATVKVYSYDDGAALSVFSISGVTMGSIDIKNLTEANAITISGAALDKIVLPKNPNLTELVLEGNNLSAIDLSAYPNLTRLSLASNNLSGTYDLSTFKNLQLASLAANQLTSVKLDNPSLWFLDLARNDFETVDLSGAPKLEQLNLGGNRLSTLDVDNHKFLKMLLIDANRFTFATLPEIKASYVLYVYANQERLKVVPDGLTIDLSSQAVAGGATTTFQWFLDEPYQDEEGVWVGEDLIEGEEFTVTDGVVKFSQDFRHLVGLLNNTAFPSLDLFTETVDVTGVENVSVSAEASVAVRGNDIVITSDGSLGAARVFSVAGSLVRTASTVAGETLIPSLAPGVYIVAIGNTSAKVAIR